MAQRLAGAEAIFRYTAESSDSSKNLVAVRSLPELSFVSFVVKHFDGWPFFTTSAG